MSAAEPVVRVKGVNYWRGEGSARQLVLDQVDLEVWPGELVILSGPSGSGKSTLLTLVGGLRTLQEGTIEIRDGRRGQAHALQGLDDQGLLRVRRLIGFIPQRYNLLGSLTALDNVRMAQQLGDGQPGSLRSYLGHEGGDRAPTSVRLLEYLGLGERLHHKPRQLSGGQQQRVAIARAVINNPLLILADEPTSALDKEDSNRVLDLLRWLARDQRCTSLIVTHDGHIMGQADRIVNLEGGKITSRVVVAERKFITDALRRCAAFAVLLPEDHVKLADEIRIELAPDRPLDPEREKELVEAGKIEVHGPGETILAQGDPVDEGSKCHLLREGVVEVFKRGEGKVGEVRAGGFVGERGLVTNEPRNATVITRERTVSYVLRRARLQEYFGHIAPFIEHIRSIFGGTSEPSTPRERGS